MNILKKIEKAVKIAKNTAIVCHQNPDGDTLGSAFALYTALSYMGKESSVICSDTIPNKYSFMNEVKIISIFEKDIYDLIIFVDCAEIKLAGNLFDGIDISLLNTINIDHHSTNSSYAKLNYVDSIYSSTAEIILDLIQYFEVEISKKIAKYIYIGIVTDTGQFAYSYTSKKTHENAAYLLGRGVEFSKINKLLFNTMPLSRLLLMKQMLGNLEIYDDGKIAISLLASTDFENSGSTSQDADSLVNILLSVDSVKIAVLIRQIDDNAFKASFRSSDDVDISKVAKLLDGGGHKQAAGATIECDIKDAIKTVLTAIEEADI